ncbi:pyridoxamine 5'-phosphate oxidase family protein [Nocardioides nanhaiensis]|uniref:Pyridoxamine 5'-phosphate oxidase family protein n=1 Tax=Nocardioides nanhaiensis TaxID=1476871 RepID=A0ABP8WUI5_9ACTN
MTTDAPLSPTPRTTATRSRHRMHGGPGGRAALLQLLTEAPVAHLGVVVGDHPVVLPVAFAVDPEGPDEGGTLYVHASAAAGWLGAAAGATVCVTVTEVDGLVLARSGFHHSMNYRCAVVIGRARAVTEGRERAHALDLTVDHVVPGRAATLRAPTRRELAATALLAVPLAEASLKTRAGGPVDEPEDVAAGGWAGTVPLHRMVGEVEAATDAVAPVPDDVVAHVERLRARAGERAG